MAYEKAPAQGAFSHGKIFSVRAARAGRDGAVFVFVCEAEVTEHLHVFLDCRAGRREHVARDGGGRAGLERGRAVLRQELAAGGEADVRRHQNRQNFQHL